MGRPVGLQWKPLGYDSDPVPGNPGQISQQAQHLASVAEQITGQVAMLQKIATTNDEVGKHADKIRSSASDLAGKLDKVVGRYRKVSSALARWVPELERAQAMSIQALDQAEGPYSQLNQSVTLPSGGNLTAQQKQQVQDYHNSMNRAQEALDEAKTLLLQAIGLRDTQGSYYAALINAACDDAVKDSFWDSFANFVDDIGADITQWVRDHAGLIKDICEVLEYVATALAIVAIFVSGGTLLLIIGAVLTGIALIGRTMLAVSGAGSWLDVIMDVIALASFGATEWLGSAFKGLVTAAKGFAAEDAMAEVIGRLAGKINDVWEMFGSDAAERIVGKFMDYLATKAPEMIPEVSEDVSRLSRLTSTGDIENVVRLRALTALAKQFPDDTRLAEILAQGSKLEDALTWNFRIATAAGVYGALSNGIQWFDVSGKKTVDLQIPGIGTAWNYLEGRLSPAGAG